MKQSRTTARTVITLVAWCITAAAHAQGFTQVRAYGDNGPGFDITVFDAPVQAGTPGPIDLSTWTGEGHYAAASGAHQTLRAMAVATGGDGVGNQVETASSFIWQTKVLPTGTAVNVGDPITVHLDLRIDGKVAAGFAPYFTHPFFVGLPGEYHLTTYATAMSRYRLYDLDSPDYEDGAPDLQFNYVGQVYAEMAAGPTFADYVSVSYESSASATLQKGVTWNWSGNIFDNTTVIGAIPSGKSLEVDTGVLSFAFDTVVGRDLRLEAELNVSAVGLIPGLSWKALADFGSTFDGELLSPVPGVGFDGLVAGVYSPSAVPEPASSLLMLVGFGTVMTLATRRRRRFTGRTT